LILLTDLNRVDYLTLREHLGSHSVFGGSVLLIVLVFCVGLCIYVCFFFLFFFTLFCLRTVSGVTNVTSNYDVFIIDSPFLFSLSFI